MLLLHFLLAVMVGVVNCNLAGGGRDLEVDGLLECISLLYLVIADEMEGSVLRKDGGFFLPGAILETEDQPACHLIATSDLGEVAFGDRDAFEIAENEKAVDQTFAIAHLDRS